MYFEGRAQSVQCTALPNLPFVRDEMMLKGFLSPTIGAGSLTSLRELKIIQINGQDWGPVLT